MLPHSNASQKRGTVSKKKDEDKPLIAYCKSEPRL